MHPLWFCDRCMPYALAVLRLVTGLIFCLTRFRSFSSLRAAPTDFQTVLSLM